MPTVRDQLSSSGAPRSHAGAAVERVRVGVALHGMKVPAWGAWVIEAINRHEGLALEAVFLLPPSPSSRTWLYRLYERLDRALFRRSPDASAAVDISDAVADIRIVGAPPLGAAPAEPVDVVVCLGMASPFAATEIGARFGAWALHLGDPERYRGEPPFFWEISRAEPWSVLALECLRVRGSQRAVAYRSVTATDPVSPERNGNAAYWAGARFFLRRLDDLAYGRWRPPRGEADGGPRGDELSPSGLDTVRQVGRIGSGLARRRLRKAFNREQWFLGLRGRNPELLPHADPSPWTPIRPPEDRLWADPFVTEADGDTLVFFEQLRWARGSGELAVARIEGSGRLTDVEVILPASHHLSYPYVFRDSGRYFMVPESGAAQRVDLWVATDFPAGWERVGPLLEGVTAVDATVSRRDGLYWMWVNLAAPGMRHDDEVHLFFSDRLEDGWTPHPDNPVVSDARRARPAGRPFVHEGALIRPSQDCTGRYGARVVFNIVERLSVDGYLEREIGALAPWSQAGVLGAHTYTFDGAIEATDGLRLVGRWRPWDPDRGRSLL